ncbi:MAG: SDR family oxidoreductase [Candidatus Hydrogenedentes bacterium]|nr:SDR family oxidoreductase [Candidatus Hydrogenedentota bacterium]
MNYADSPVALVTGATGVAGASIVEYLSEEAGWQVVALSRSAASVFASSPRVTPVSADMLDPEQLRVRLGGLRITHLFHAAEYRLPWPNDSKQKPTNVRAMKTMLNLSRPFVPLVAGLGRVSDRIYYTPIAKAAGLYDPDKRNLAMLRNVVETLERSPHALRHVSTITGGRYNGMHLGPYLYPAWKIPFEETDPPHPGPSWYFDIEGYLKNRQNRAWTWSVARPSFIIGFTSRAAHNFGTAIAVYASVLKKLGEPLAFPGGEGAYSCVWEASSANLLARVMHWSATEPAAADNVFNLVNGNTFRWCDLWPRIAEYFGMECVHTKDGFSVQRKFLGKETLWRELVAEHGLQKYELRELMSPRFLDESMVIDWDVVFSMEKARRLGFDATVDNAQMFCSLFDRLREKKIIPG